jgi:hypothetical protein
MRETLKFFWQFTKSSTNNLPNQQVVWTILGAPAEVDVYIPQHSNNQTLLLMHGMSIVANKDPRMQRIASHFAALGFCVVLPRIETIAQLLIEDEQVQAIAECMQQLCEDEVLCPTGRFGIFAFSFTSSLTLAAIFNYNLSKNIKTLMSLSFAPCGGTAIQELISADCPDNYGHYVAMKNAYFFLDEVDPVYDMGFTALIQDEYTCGPDDHFTKYMSSLQERLQEKASHFFARIIGRDKNLSQNLLERVDIAGFKKKFPFKDYIDQLNFNFYILQGENDSILHTKHLVQLDKELDNKRCKIHITSLLDHANLKFSFKAVISFFKLFWHMKAFIKDALT